MKEQRELSGKLQGVAKTLERLAERHAHHEMSFENQSAKLQHLILGSLYEKAQVHSQSSNSAKEPDPFPLDILSNLRLLESEAVLLHKQLNFLESLKFPSIAEREEDIKKAHPRTFEWLFEEADERAASGRPFTILEWLEVGVGTYWVSGKAGSGKSTLMNSSTIIPKRSVPFKNGPATDAY